MRIATLTLITLTSACTIVRGSGDLATETRTVPAFEAVTAHNGVEVDLVVDPQTSGDVDLMVATDTNLMDQLKTDVTGGVLEVDIRGNVSTQLGMEVSGTVGPLNAVTATDGAVLAVEGLQGTIVDVKALDGAVLWASGQVDDGSVTVADGAVFDGFDLTYGDVNVDIRDGAVADVCATGEVTGRVVDGAVLTVRCGGRTGSVRVADGGVLSR